MADRDAFGNEITPSDVGTAFGASAEPAPPGEAPAPPRPTRSAEEPTAFTAPTASGASGEQSAVFGAGHADGRPTAGAETVTAPSREATTGALSGVTKAIRSGVGLVAAVVLIGGCAVTELAGPVSDGIDAYRDIKTQFAQTTPVAPLPTTSPGATQAPADPPRGLASGSLLRRVPFTRAISELRSSGLGRPRSLRVAADRIDAQLVTRTGRLRSVQIVPGGALQTLSTSSSGGFPQSDAVSLAAIDRGAPQRLARAAAGRTKLPATRVDYLVLSASGGTTRWTAFVRNGPAYSADRTGRIERRIR